METETESNSDKYLDIINKIEDQFKNKVIRIRKANNKQYYTDQLLMNEFEYNSLFRREVLLHEDNNSDGKWDLKNLVDHSETVKTDKEEITSALQADDCGGDDWDKKNYLSPPSW